MLLKMRFLPALTLLLGTVALASANFTTRQLDEKDYIEIRNMAEAQTRTCYSHEKHVDEAPMELADGSEIDSSGIRQTPELRRCLKGVLEFLFTRREQNDAVQRDLVQKALWEIQESERLEVLKEAAQDAIEKYKRNDDNKELQSTAYEQIKNVMTEAQALAHSSTKNDVRPIFRLVRDAGLDVDSKLESFRANGPSGISPNLSEKAAGILKSLDRSA
jgi:hypothetical protein